MSSGRIFTRLGPHFIRWTYNGGDTRIVNINQIHNIMIRHSKKDIDINGHGSRTCGASEVTDTKQWQKELEEILFDYNPTPNNKLVDARLAQIEEHLSVVAESVKKAPPSNPFTSPESQTRTTKGRKVGVFPRK